MTRGRLTRGAKLNSKRARALTEQAAHLRAEIKRDEKMRREVAGGLCPILSERCLNIGEDRTLDEYFTDQLVTNQAALVTVEGEHKELSLSLRDAREPHTTRLAPNSPTSVSRVNGNSSTTTARRSSGSTKR